MELIGVLGFFTTIVGMMCIESTLKVMIIGLLMMAFSYLICTITDKVLDMDRYNYENTKK